MRHPNLHGRLDRLPRRHPVLLLAFLLLAGCKPSENLPDLITHLSSAPESERAALVDSLMAALAVEGAPVVEDSLAHFLYRGAATGVALAGDMTDWKPALQLEQVGGTDLWHGCVVFPLDTRLDYKLVVDGRWILDPLNPRTITGGFGPNSELVMPAYASAPEISDHGAPPCEIFTHENFPCPQLGGARTIKVVKAPGADPTQEAGFLLVHDGLEYLSLGSLANVLSWLAAEYPDVFWPVCVCVPPVKRTEEYAGASQEHFGAWLVENVMAFVEKYYAVGRRCRWASMGASNGGNISLYLAGSYPDRFDKLLIMSPYVSGPVRERFESLPPESLRLYMNWGRYDLARLIPSMEDFAASLRERGVPHLARRYNEGHSWGFWRATIDEGLIFLYADGERR